MEHTRSLELVPDDELLRRLTDVLQQSRRVEADLVALIGEVDARRLYAREASPSMFAWCTEVLHLSEAEAYLRIAAARASREHPMLLDDAGRRAPAPDRRREAGTAPDPGEPGRPPEAGDPQDQATDRGAGRRGGASSRRAGGDAEAAGAPDGHRAGSRPPTRFGRSGRGQFRTASGRSRRAPARVAAADRSEQHRGRTPSRRSCRTGPAGDRRAPRPRPLQGPVHGLRRTARQARAAAGPHALLGARRRPGRDHRRGRHREARAARGPPLRPDEGSTQGALGEREVALLTPHPGRGPEGRARARRRALPLRGRAGPPMHRTRRARVPPPAPVRAWRRPLGRQRLLAVSAHNDHLAEVDYGRGAMARHRRSKATSPSLREQA